jgi:uncharacterized membrane protein (DUF485 family)
MTKFAKQVMNGIEGIEVFPLISMGIFFTFFVLLGIYVIKADKKYVHEMSELPLENDQNQEK